jgi:cytochrome c oxidase subunit 2
MPSVRTAGRSPARYGGRHIGKDTMKVHTWVIVAGSVAVLLALGGLYIAFDLWAAKTQIDAWSQVKYQSRPPPAELPIEIAGWRFEWRIRYPSSRRIQSDPQLAESFAKEASADHGQADDLHFVNELHLWKGGVVYLSLKSGDVPHSFFVPVLRLKQEAVPGKVTFAWLTASENNVTWDPEAGDWKLGDPWEFVCAEHYAQSETRMGGRLFVHETKDDFLKWLKRAEEGRLHHPGKQ